MHTKGIWGVAKVNYGEDNDEICTEINGCYISIAEIFGNGSFSTATVDGKNEPHYEVSNEESDANARLIAAAPELFEACKKMLVCIGSDPRFYAEQEYAIEALKKVGVKKFGTWL